MSWNIVVAFLFFFFNDTATTEIYTLSLHDALPISSAFRTAAKRVSHSRPPAASASWSSSSSTRARPAGVRSAIAARSEEHTSELQSHVNLVCRLLLEKKKKKKHHYDTYH